MTAKSPAIETSSAPEPRLGSNLVQVDAYLLTDADDEELPEWSEEQVTRAEIRDGDMLVRAATGTFTRPRGRPRVENPKQQQTLRLSVDVLDHFRNSGRGWQGRIDAALKEWISAQR
jgi:uncharacterized protein (DUF4415 family)